MWSENDPGREWSFYSHSKLDNHGDDGSAYHDDLIGEKFAFSVIQGGCLGNFSRVVCAGHINHLVLLVSFCLNCYFVFCPSCYFVCFCLRFYFTFLSCYFICSTLVLVFCHGCYFAFTLAITFTQFDCFYFKITAWTACVFSVFFNLHPP